MKEGGSVGLKYLTQTIVTECY